MPANPYAAPQAKEAAPPVKMLAVRRGGEIGVLAHVDLPPFCAKCGRAAKGRWSKRQFIGVGSGILVGLVSTIVIIGVSVPLDGPAGGFSLLLTLIGLPLLMMRRVEWTLPLCRRCVDAWLKFDQGRFRMVPLVALLGLGIAFGLALLPLGFASSHWRLVIPAGIIFGVWRLTRHREVKVMVRLQATSPERLWFTGISEGAAAVWCQTPAPEDTATPVK